MCEVRMKATVARQGHDRSAEKVMDKSRRAREIADGVGTDDDESISQEFANTIKRSPILLDFFAYKELDGGRIRYLGQAFILHCPETISTHFVTCLHNICTESNAHGEMEVCEGPHSCTVTGDSKNQSAFVKFPSTGWVLDESRHKLELRDGVFWKHGFDVSVGPCAKDATSAEDHWAGHTIKNKTTQATFSPGQSARSCARRL